MCTNPITIPTRSRYLSMLHRQPLYQTCGCGKCFECQQLLHSQWYYRIYHEWLDTVESGGYVFFDTLTYNDDNLPHMSDFFDVERGSVDDFPCFSRVHIRKFLTRLDSRLRTKFNVDSSVYHRFIAAEYGTDENHTHRPHYHILFFIKPCGLDVFALRDEVHNAWNRGITDYVRTRGKKANYFVGRNNRSELAVSNYVAKYVQKVSVFQNAIDKRISRYLDKFVRDRYAAFVVRDGHVDFCSQDTMFSDEVKFVEFENSFRKSVTFKKECSRVHRLVGQFHCQSNGFGLSALRDVDLLQLIETGILTMPDCKHVVRNIPLPVYYRRVLFQKQVYIDGRRCWIDTELGLRYKRASQSRLCKYLASKYRCANDFFKLNLQCDFDLLAKYVVFYKGRNKGQLGNDVSAYDVLSLPRNFVWYNYSSPSDVQDFHLPLLSKQRYRTKEGFVFGRYKTSHLESCVSRDFVFSRSSIDDTFCDCFNGFDKVIAVIERALSRVSYDKQKLFDFKQDFRNKYSFLYY